MDNRQKVMIVLAALIEMAEGDERLRAAAVLLCTVGAGIADGDATIEEMIDALKPAMDRMTRQRLPELWALMQEE